MILPTCLIFALCGCIYTSYGQSHAGPKGPTPQPGAFFAAWLSGATGSTEVDLSLLSFPSPSLPLSAASTTFAAPSSPGRCQSRFYGQTATPSRGTAPQLFSPYFAQPESNRQPGVDGNARSKAEAWLSAGPALRPACSWNINGIACCRPSWSRPMNCCFRIDCGPWPQRRRT